MSVSAQENKNQVVSVGLVICVRPKNNGVSVISIIVTFVSVLVSVRENHKYINGVVMRIYILIYT